MHLLRLTGPNHVSLVKNLTHESYPYAILSHTWGSDDDEVTFADVEAGRGQDKAGYAKIIFCGEQAKRDGIEHFWVDTCCINKPDLNELSEAITSMFRWYHDAVKCYVYLSDVSTDKCDNNVHVRLGWECSFKSSRWFTRGWTLQELLAPNCVEFYSKDQELLGSKTSLAKLIYDITDIPIKALHGAPLSDFLVPERLRWASKRETKKKEDAAYCLFGIFNVFMPLIYGEGDHAFIRLKEEIAKRSVSSGQHAHTHWMVPRSPNSLFTGRQILLKDLENIIRSAVLSPSDRDQCRIVIYGLGGQGKSEICLQLARCLRQLFWAVFWIDVSTPDLAKESFLDVAKKLSIPAQRLEDARLGIANLHHPWLLVLDNADEPDTDYQDYFPDSRLGVVLMTTRNDQCRQYATTDQAISLDGLHRDDGRDLLLKAANVVRDQDQQNERDASEVAKLLSSHPLALIQAGAYISRGQCTLAAYPDHYKTQRRRLLKYRPKQAKSRYQDVYTTFEVSADMLKAMDTEAALDALHLLPLLAACAPNPLPLSLFESAWKGSKHIDPRADECAERELEELTTWHVARLPSFIDTSSSLWNASRLGEAVALLKAFSLISIDTYNTLDCLYMHALVHAWARDRQEDNMQRASWLEMTCMVAIPWNEQVLSPGAQRALRPHVIALSNKETNEMFATWPDRKVVQLLLVLGWVLENMQLIANLSAMIARLLGYLHLNSSRFEKQWAGLYRLVAAKLVDCHKAAEAVPLLENLVAMRELTLPPDHRYRLGSQRELAVAYTRNGQSLESVELLEKVVEFQEETCPGDNYFRLSAQQELGVAYRDNMQILESIKVLEKVVTIMDRTLSEDDPTRLRSQHELALAYQDNKQFKESVGLWKHVVEIERQTLPEDDRDRLLSQYELAVSYREIGQFQESVKLLEHVVRIEEETLPEDNLDRLSSRHELAASLWCSGRREAGFEMMGDVAKTKRQFLDESNADLSVSDDWLAYMESQLLEQEQETKEVESDEEEEEEAAPEEEKLYVKDRAEEEEEEEGEETTTRSTNHHYQLPGCLSQRCGRLTCPQCQGRPFTHFKAHENPSAHDERRNTQDTYDDVLD